MPELPDIEVYAAHLRRRVVGQPLARIRVVSPFVVRSFDPPLAEAHGRRVQAVRRLGKRIVLDLDPDLYLIVHLMIAGRLRWRPPGAALAKKLGLAAFDFADGALLLTEASTKKRAAIHLVRGKAALELHDPGGIEPLDADAETFQQAIQRENHTIKRALTDPHVISGIGNAYSDEILWRARMAPTRRTASMNAEDLARLRDAVQATLRAWTERLLRETGDAFPEKVTAFHEGMAVHGRYGKPCPECGSPVQRITYAENESNYCARCQTGGKLLADRAMSRLLHGDWPKTLDDLEERKRRRSQ
jgi:formamidopyrimidine-DNA glycosylase